MYCCKWNSYFWLVISIILALSACNKQKKTSKDFYFDSGKYIESEVSNLKASISSFDNTITFNGESETRNHVSADSSIYKEMQHLFKQANINSGMLKGEYTIDTFWIQDPSSQENIEVWNYTTQNEALKVKYLQVYSNGSIKASVSQKNFLFSYEKVMYYEKNKKFSVVTWQKTLGQDTLNIFNSMEFF